MNPRPHRGAASRVSVVDEQPGQIQRRGPSHANGETWGCVPPNFGSVSSGSATSWKKGGIYRFSSEGWSMPSVQDTAKATSALTSST